ncbi:hypothetical protein BRPE67_BCDS05610 [Caballeronia cordobensis]|nr:hypothetical protein BRPE67_BCDS05610 [Burkholderia sp. RPE67]
MVGQIAPVEDGRQKQTAGTRRCVPAAGHIDSAGSIQRIALIVTPPM